MEEKALSKEKDKASQERLGEVRKELAALEDKLRPLMVRHSGALHSHAKMTLCFALPRASSWSPCVRFRMQVFEVVHGVQLQSVCTCTWLAAADVCVQTCSPRSLAL